jgi:hypothetical protein
MGYSFCRFGCGIPDRDMGSCDFYDGEWLWPQGLAHYIERHSVRLPDEFIQTMRSHSWQVPVGIEFSPGAKRAALKKVGYWWSPDEAALPHPRVLVQPGCYGEELPRILAYLRAGRGYLEYLCELWEYMDEQFPGHKDEEEYEFRQEDISFWLTWAGRHGSK